MSINSNNATFPIDGDYVKKRLQSLDIDLKKVINPIFKINLKSMNITFLIRKGCVCAIFTPF